MQSIEFFDEISGQWVKSKGATRSKDRFIFKSDDSGEQYHIEWKDILVGKIRCRGLLQHALLGFHEQNLVDGRRLFGHHPRCPDAIRPRVGTAAAGYETV